MPDGPRGSSFKVFFCRSDLVPFLLFPSNFLACLATTKILCSKKGVQEQKPAGRSRKNPKQNKQENDRNKVCVCVSRQCAAENGLPNNAVLGYREFIQVSAS
jgi:hypothetical protein